MWYDENKEYPSLWLGRRDYLAGYCFLGPCCLHGDVLTAMSLHVLQWCHSKNLTILASPLKVLKNFHCVSLRRWETGYTMLWLNHHVIMCPKYRQSSNLSNKKPDTKRIFVCSFPITFLVFYLISAFYLLFQGWFEGLSSGKVASVSCCHLPIFPNLIQHRRIILSIWTAGTFHISFHLLFYGFYRKTLSSDSQAFLCLCTGKVWELKKYLFKKLSFSVLHIKPRFKTLISLWKYIRKV